MRTGIVHAIMRYLRCITGFGNRIAHGNIPFFVKPEMRALELSL